jgi:hypothetical protein
MSKPFHFSPEYEASLECHREINLLLRESPTWRIFGPLTSPCSKTRAPSLPTALSAVTLDDKLAKNPRSNYRDSSTESEYEGLVMDLEKLRRKGVKIGGYKRSNLQIRPGKRIQEKRSKNTDQEILTRILVNGKEVICKPIKLGHNKWNKI